jgi:hypothetical protein
MKTLMILRGVNMDTLDSDAPSECEDWGGRLGRYGNRKLLQRC